MLEARLAPWRWLTQMPSGRLNTDRSLGLLIQLLSSSRVKDPEMARSFEGELVDLCPGQRPRAVARQDADTLVDVPPVVTDDLLSA